VDRETLRDLWPVVLLGVLLPCTWLAVGALGARMLLAREQRQFVRFAAVTVAYPNAFAIPYPLLQALSRQVDWLRARDGADAFSATVAMLFSLVLLLQVWTGGFWLYGQAAKQERESLALAHSQGQDAAPAEVEAKSNDAGGAAGDEAKSRRTAGSDGSGCAGETGSSQAELHGGGESVLAVPDVDLEDAEGCSACGLRRDSSMRRMATAAVLTGTGGARALRQVVNPLLLSLLVAIALAISPLRRPFVDSALHDVAVTVGAVAVPLTLVQLGAGMARPPPTKAATGTLSWWSAAVIVGLRLVGANVIGSAIITGFRSLGWLRDRHTALCLYLTCCSPTAANVALVSSVQQAYVQPTALVLFVMQLACIPTITVSIAIYLALLA